MKSEIAGLRPGEPSVVDDWGRKLSLTLRLIPETPAEVAELKWFCRLTDEFNFIIDEQYRANSAHIAPVYAEKNFSIARPTELVLEAFENR